MAQRIVSREWMINYIANQPREKVVALVGRALVALHARQTREEQYATTTLLHNDVGFTGADGRVGTLSARAYKSKGTLLDWQLDQWTKPNVNGIPRIAKYWAQLNEIAIEKAAKGPKGCSRAQYVAVTRGV